MNENVKLLFAGDIYINSEITSEKIISSELENVFKQHLIISGNFEGPLYKKNSKKLPKAGTHLSQYKDSAKYVINSGFNLVNLANNHIFDYGSKSLGKNHQSI